MRVVGTNVEQLFATGYAANPNFSGGFVLKIELVTNMPTIDCAIAEQLITATPSARPYSNATLDNIDVTVGVALAHQGYRCRCTHNGPAPAFIRR